MANEYLYSTIVGRVKDIIVGLSLTGVDSTHISVVKLPWVREFVQTLSALPWVIIAREQDKNIPSTNEAYDVAYGVWVIYVAKGNQDLTSSTATSDTWRQQITRKFQARDIIASLAIQEVYNCRVEAATPEWPEGFASQLDVGALRIIVTTREPR